MFYQNPAVFNAEHLVHKLVSGSGAATDMALEHGYLRFR
jgi:hypothetical protein